jgi:hypothetical protein
MSGIYTASKARHAHIWVKLRAEGLPIASTWIDEPDDDRVVDMLDLWDRCVGEAARAAVTLVYHEPGDVLRGAYVEMGAALASGKPVVWCGRPEAGEPSALRHRGITRVENLDEALALALRICKRAEPSQ